MSGLTVFESKLINNTAYCGNAVYAHDSNYVIINSTFANNTNDIYTVFDQNVAVLDGNSYSGKDSLVLNTTLYESYITVKGAELPLLNNTINSLIFRPNLTCVTGDGFHLSGTRDGWVPAGHLE